MTDNENREAVARIIAPEGWRAFDEETRDCKFWGVDLNPLPVAERFLPTKSSLQRADSILALIAAPMKAVGRAYCQKCGGKVEGWLCQSCDQEFREDDAGNLVFDDDEPSPPMEAVAWRVRDKDDPRGWWLYGGHETETVAELKRQEHEVQALAVIPTEGGGHD